MENNELEQRFHEWWEKLEKNSVVIMWQSKRAYIQGALDERQEIINKLKECQTYENFTQVMKNLQEYL